LIISFAAHDVRAAVVQGNVLLAVWRMDPGVGTDGVWYSYTELDVPESPVVPLATAPVDYSSLQNVVETSPALVAPEVSLTPESPPQPEMLDAAPPSNLGRNPALPIIIGIIPVLLVLIGVVWGYRFFANRRE